jgi:hypothetical protein
MRDPAFPGSGVADDATKALEILSGFEGVSLCEAARFYKIHHHMRGKAPTLREAWDKALAKREALPYWKILPSGIALPATTKTGQVKRARSGKAKPNARRSKKLIVDESPPH